MAQAKNPRLARAIITAGFAILLGGIGFLVIRQFLQHPSQGLLGTTRSLHDTPFCRKYRCVLARTHTDEATQGGSHSTNSVFEVFVGDLPYGLTLSVNRDAKKRIYLVVVWFNNYPDPADAEFLNDLLELMVGSGYSPMELKADPDPFTACMEQENQDFYEKTLRTGKVRFEGEAEPRPYGFYCYYLDINWAFEIRAQLRPTAIE